jgi:3-deoxy-D-manno-octulosonate 8-phosphate phosphatase (KDO 8-P phosphatase)
MKNYKEIMREIRAFVFDVDGVLTDGKVTLMPDGEQVRVMNTRDGYAMKYAMKQGYKVCIITGGNAESVRKRMHYLGIYDVYLAAYDKMDCLEDFKAIYDINEDQIAYMGDDLPDYEVMQHVALAACPNDAAHQIKEISTYISPIDGGQGCVRELIEQTLMIQGKWENDSDTASN